MPHTIVPLKKEEDMANAPPSLPPGFAGPVKNNIECSILVSTYSYHMSALDDHQPKEPLEVELRLSVKT